MSTARKARVTLTKVSGKSTKDYSGYVKSFTYTDVYGDTSDSFSAEFDDKALKYMDGWMPKKGNKFTASVLLSDWLKDGENKKIKFGKFILDDFSLSGRPLSCTISAVSMPSSSAFSTKQRTKTWKKITIQQIAKKIAKRYKLALVYDAEKITIKSIEQKDETDSSFLNSLCKDYGIAMKIFNSKLVIYSEAKYEKKKAAFSVSEKEMLSWTYNDTVAGTYTGAKYSYQDPKSNKTIKVQVGKGSRWLTAQGEAGSKADAQKKAYAAVNNSNKDMTTIKFEIMANPKMIATACIKITGLQNINGKYFVTKVTHNIGTKYTMSVEARKVQQRLPKKKG